MNTIGPHYPLFKFAAKENATFLGTQYAMDSFFDVYIVDSCVGNIKEIVAVPALHETRGPIAMAAPLCKKYELGHPLHTGWRLADANNLL